MHTLNQENLERVLAHCEPPCLSLFQPTHRHRPENEQDPIRFKNLVKRLEESLKQRASKHEVFSLLKPFWALAEDPSFWKQTQDGLAVLGSKDVFEVFRLQRAVKEFFVVADTFHTKPLLRILQSADRYQVLGLNRQEIRLYEGNHEVLDEIELAPDVPRTMKDALGEELTSPHQTVASYGGVGPGRGAMHHGHGDKASEVDIDTERFFRAVARGISEHHSQPSGLPLILATLPEHRQLFHRVSRNPYLLEEGLDTFPDNLSLTEIRRRVWEVLEPRYLERLAALNEDFGTAKAKGLGTEKVTEAAEAVVAGRIATLLVEADRVIPGRVDVETGEISYAKLANPMVDDLLDDLGTLALRRGAKIIVVPAEQMPTKTGLAAIYRY